VTILDDVALDIAARIAAIGGEIDAQRRNVKLKNGEVHPLPTVALATLCELIITKAGGRTPSVAPPATHQAQTPPVPQALPQAPPPPPAPPPIMVGGVTPGLQGDAPLGMCATCGRNVPKHLLTTHIMSGCKDHVAR